MGTWRDPEKDNWVTQEAARIAAEKKAQSKTDPSKKLSSKQKKQLAKKEAIELKAATKNLEQKYYNEVFPAKQQEQVQQALAANPNLKLNPGRNSQESGVLVDEKTGQSYPLPNPAAVRMDKSKNNRAAAVRSSFVLQQAASGQPYNARPKEMNAYVKANHGGGGLLGSITKSIGGALPKITVGGDIGKVAQQVGKVATEAGNVAKSSLEAQAKLATGDFKGAGQSAMKGFSSASNIAGTAGGQVGAIVGQRKLGEAAGKIGAEATANVVTSGGYGLAKQAASSLASGGIGGLVSGKGLQDAALSAAGSYAGVDPNALNVAKMGLSAAQGDIKGAATQGLGSYAGLSPNEIKMASTGVSALTGDKRGAASGLASQFGAGDSASSLIGNVAGGNMDFKKMALEKLGSFGGLSPEQIKMAESALGGNISGLTSGAASQLGAGGAVSSMVGQFAGGKGAREVVSDQAGAYAQDQANTMLDQQQRDLLNRTQKSMPYNFEEERKRADELKRNFEQVKATAGSQSFDPKVAYSDWAKQQKGYIGKEKKAYMQDLFNKRAAGKISNDEFNKGYESQGQKGFVDKAKDFFGGAKNFAAENKDVIGLGAQGVAAGLGYGAAKDSMEAQQSLLEQQRTQAGGIGSELIGTKYDKDRYAPEQQYRQEQIEGRGRSSLTRQMEQESQEEAGKMSQSAIQAGVERQARLGGAAGIGTSALTSAYAGNQAARNAIARDKRARDTQAEQTYEQALQRSGQLKTQQTKEEAELAALKAEAQKAQSQQSAAAYSGLSNIESARGTALQNLYSTGANLVQSGLKTLSTDEEKQKAQEQENYDMQMRNAKLAQEQQKVNQTPQQTNLIERAKAMTGNSDVIRGGQPQAPAQQQNLQTKAGAAKIVGGDTFAGQERTYKTGEKVTSEPMPARQQFNNQNMSMPQTQQPAQGGFQQMLQGAQKKGQELISKIPEAQKKQIMDQGKKIVGGLVKNLPFKI